MDPLEAIRVEDEVDFKEASSDWSHDSDSDTESSSNGEKVAKDWHSKKEVLGLVPRMYNFSKDAEIDASFEVIEVDAAKKQISNPWSNLKIPRMRSLYLRGTSTSPASTPSSTDSEKFSDDILRSNEERFQEIPHIPACDDDILTSSNVISIRGLIQICGRDARGRPIVVIDVSCCPPPYMRFAALGHIRERMEPIVESGEYHLVFVMSPNPRKGDYQKEIPTWWCLDVYRKLPYLYKKHIQRVVFIHPTLFVKVVLNVLRPFISSKAYLKIARVYRLSDLENATSRDISLDKLYLGPHVYAHEKFLENSSRTIPDNKLLNRKRITWFKGDR